MKYIVKSSRLSLSLIFVFVVLSVGCSRNSYYIQPEESSVIYPLTETKELNPGLKVRYYDKKYKHVTDMPKGKELEQLGRPGKPVLSLNNVYGKTSNIFGSGKSRLVGFWFSGLIHLEQPGIYYFQALSNDGIRCFLNREMLFEDPAKHSSRLSPVGSLNVEQPGWYPLQIIYFQRKGTAALKFYWKQPGQSSFSIVPSYALAHKS